MRIGADEHLLVNQRSKMWMSEAKMVSENMSEADLVTRELLKASKTADLSVCGVQIRKSRESQQINDCFSIDA